MKPSTLMLGALLFSMSAVAQAESVDLTVAADVQACFEQQGQRYCTIPTFPPQTVTLNLQKQQIGERGVERWHGTWQQGIDASGLQIKAQLAIEKTVMHGNLVNYSIAATLGNPLEPAHSVTTKVGVSSVGKLNPIDLYGATIRQEGRDLTPILHFGPPN